MFGTKIKAAVVACMLVTMSNSLVAQVDSGLSEFIVDGAMTLTAIEIGKAYKNVWKKSTTNGKVAYGVPVVATYSLLAYAFNHNDSDVRYGIIGAVAGVVATLKLWQQRGELDDFVVPQFMQKTDEASVSKPLAAE